MNFLSELSDWLFLDNGTCPVCGRVLFGRDAWLCSRCFEDLPLNDTGVCRRCGRPMAGGEDGLCSDCMKDRNNLFDGGFSWLKYGKIPRKIVEEIKFNSRRELARWIGIQIARAASDAGFSIADGLIVPVPLHPNRLKERGYNQSEMLARGLAEGLGEQAHVKVFTGLARVVDTPHQIGKDREERIANVRNAFAVDDSEKISGRKIYLVDDVLTTGSTLRACAKALKEAGAAEVHPITCASLSQ